MIEVTHATTGAALYLNALRVEMVGPSKQYSELTVITLGSGVELEVTEGPEEVRIRLNGALNRLHGVGG